MKSNMKSYDHKNIEKKWQKEWEKSGMYKTSEIHEKPPASAKGSGQAKKCYVLDKNTPCKIVMEIYLSSRFKKSFQKLHPQIQKRRFDKIAIFRENPFTPKLDTHKLHGEKKEEWAFSVDYSY